MSLLMELSDSLPQPPVRVRTAATVHLLGYTALIVPRLVGVQKQDFHGFGCSDCNWRFEASGAFAGKSIDEMKSEYAPQRDKESALHVCSKSTPLR
jgi:hypothetical protein